MAGACALATTPAQATIRYVNSSRPDDSGDGLSWAAAEKTLQAALAAAVSGDEIWVVAGTYKPDRGPTQTPGDRQATFQLISGVAVYGGFGGTEALLSQRNATINVTILSGDLSSNDGANFSNYGDNSFHVATASGTDATAILDGFTVRSGSADATTFVDNLGGGILALSGSPTIRNCTLQANRAEYGGGFYADNSTSLIDNCLITTNRSDSFASFEFPAQGGGVVFDTGSNGTIANSRFLGNTSWNDAAALALFRCSATISDCTFENNSVSGSADPGGPVALIFQSGFTFTRCTFRNNTGTFWGGAIINEDLSLPGKYIACVFENNSAGATPNSAGGAVMNRLARNLKFVNCTFRGNTALRGGAVYNWTESDVEFWNCEFLGNQATESGGAVRNLSSLSPSFTNCVFNGNTASQFGGAIRTQSSTPTVINCTFSRNSAGTSGGGLYNESGSVVSVNNSILFANSDASGMVQASQIFNTGGGTASVNYSLVGGWTGSLGGTGNIGGDPLFVDPDGADNVVGTLDDDLSIQFPSRCIDAGNNAAVPSDSEDLDGDTNTVEPLPIDLSGRPRFLEDARMSDIGSGTPPLVDIGAYEAGALVFVDASATGANTGSNWANAFTSLQDALTVSTTGSEIWVAKGTYRPAGPGGSRSATFQLKSGVALYGGFAGGESSRDLRDPVHNVTILSGDLNGNDADVACTTDAQCALFGRKCLDGRCIIRQNNTGNSYHVVTGSATNSTAVLDGFRITAGYADGVNPDDVGAGISNSSTGSPTVTNCTFSGNLAKGGGGGMHNFNNSSPTVTNCTFTGNSAVNTGNGGGIGNDSGSSPTVTNCTFNGNSAVGGGGMLNANNSSPTVTNCTFSRNLGVNAGGGMDNASNGSPTVTNCTFSGNTASSGGGMYNLLSNSIPTVTNCTFSGNMANEDGGGMVNNFSASPTVTNSVFWGNVDDADANGGGPFMDESAQIYTASGTPVVNYSIVQGTWSGAGGNNLSSDPLFFDAGSGNVRLQSGSPAINAGDTTALPLDTFDLDGDGNTIERLSRDLGGNPRILDGVVDMGAYEYFSDCNHNSLPDACDVSCGPVNGPCRIPGCGTGADCNSNGVLDACDIAACAGSPSCKDCNLNGRPDGCDVPSSAGCPSGSCVSGCSIDADQNCEPDECATTTGTGGTANWNDGTNWSLAGSFPDNSAGVADKNVTLEDSLILNIQVTIDSLQIVSGVTLDVTGGNLLITGDAAQTAGITPPPKVRLSLDGAIAMANGYDVTLLSDSVAVNNGGVYHSTGATDSALSAVDIAVYAGGELTLEHNMTMTSSGRLILDGAGVTMPVPCLPFAVAGNVAGITPPPKLRLRDIVIAYAAASLSMVGAVEVTVDSTEPVLLGGNFDNRSIVPHLFDWAAGKLTLDGTMPQTFEVAGINLGQTSQGFLTDVDALSDTCQHTNYSMGTVEVAATASVTFANRFANTAAVGCAEALYVHNLIFQSGATVTIDNCKMYYDTLTPNGVTPTLIGCGELLSTTRPVTPSGDPSSIKKNRGLALSIPGSNTAGPGSLTALRVALVELQNPVPSNLLQNPPPDFSAYEFASTCTDPGGCGRWIGEPKVFLESQDSPGSGNFKAARLQCTPLYRDWTTAGFFYVVGAEITPSSKYDVQQFAQACAGRESGCTAISAPLRITTARYGDVEAPFNPPSTTTQPDAIDVAQVVAKVKNLPGALVKSITQLQPNLPELNGDVNALDIVAVVDAAKGFAYAFSGPCPCPSLMICGSLAPPAGTPCATDAVCIALPAPSGGGSGAKCVKTCVGGTNAGEPCINDTHGHCPSGGVCGNGGMTPGFCRDRCGRCTPP